MELYAIRRRHAFVPDQVPGRVARANDVASDMSEHVRRIRSYMLTEDGGTLGTVCIYGATGSEGLRTHARLSGLPADEIRPVVDTVGTRPDHDPAGQAAEQHAAVGSPTGGNGRTR